jgi:hypothetical protein
MVKKLRKEIRVLAVDDSPFDKNKQEDVLVIGTYFRGGQFMDGLLSTKVRKDGTNSTKKLTDVINRCKWRSTIRAILLDGIALAGFNIVDIKKLNKATSIPVIIVIRKYPNISEMEKALKKMKKQSRINLIEKAGEIYRVKNIYIQIAGISIEKAKEIIEITTTYADIPEPIRIAHIIAAGIVKGESKGRA